MKTKRKKSEIKGWTAEERLVIEGCGGKKSKSEMREKIALSRQQ